MHIYVLRVKGGREQKAISLLNQVFAQLGFESEYHLSLLKDDTGEQTRKNALPGYVVILTQWGIDPSFWYQVREKIRSANQWIHWPQELSVDETKAGGFWRMLLKSITEFVQRINERLMNNVIEKKQKRVLSWFKAMVIGLIINRIIVACECAEITSFIFIEDG